VVVVVALVATTLVGVGFDGGVAGATTTMTVTPTGGIRDGQQVSATIESDVARHIVTVCESNLADGDVGVPVWYSCFMPTDASGQLIVTPVEPGTPTTVQITVKEHLVQLGGELSTECGVAPGDCSIVDLEIPDGASPLWDATVAARVPIDVDRKPAVRVTPQVGLPPTASVAYTGSYFAAKDVLIRQCTAAWAAAPDPATVDHACAAATTVTPTAGAVSATIAVADPLVTVDGTSVPCSFSSCVLAAGYADELVRVSTSIGFATPTYTISQTENLVPGSAVQVSVDDVPAGLVFVNLCASGRGCAPSTTTITVSGGSGSAAVPVGPGGWLTTTGQYTTCQESDCYLQLRSYPDFRYLNFVKVPVTFVPSRQLVVDPMLGLRDGQSVAFRGYGLTPGASYSVRTCDLLAVSCGADQAVVVADPGGKVAGTLTVTQAPGQYGACGLPCLVRLRAVAGGEPELTRAYTIRQGTIDSTPQEGLADGQTVTVTGTDLPPTYTGTPRWLATGGWSLAQCESPVLGTQLDLAGAFTKCGVPPGGGTVTTVTTNSIYFAP